VAVFNPPLPLKSLIFLKNTNKMIGFKLYGSHRNGNFNAYINKTDEDALIAELGLMPDSNHLFDFLHFMKQLNDAIPNSLPINTKVETLRNNRDVINKLSPVDDSKKTVFNGVMQLEKGVKSPRDKTLRKLYMYTDTDPMLVSKFIQLLKQRNMTVKWTTPNKKECNANIDNILKGWEV